MSDLPISMPIRVPLAQPTSASPTIMTSEQSLFPAISGHATSFHPQSLTLQTMPPNTTSKSRLQSLLPSLPKLEISKPLQTFTLFSELPKELRDMVWEQVASKSRLIPVHVYSRYFLPSPERRLSFLGIPSILLVSREVRQEGLKYYQQVVERAFHPSISVSSSLATASTSSLAIEATADADNSGDSDDSDDSDDIESTLLSWSDIMSDDEAADKVAVRRTVYLNFDRDIFSIPNIRHVSSSTHCNFDTKGVSKIQRLSIMTTPVCGRYLVNDDMFYHLFYGDSLRVVRVYIEHAWCRRPGDNDFLAADSDWIRWEKHIKSKITNNREALQARGLVSSFTFYWKYQGTKSSSLASWKIQRKSKHKKQVSKPIPPPGPPPDPSQETS